MDKETLEFISKIIGIIGVIGGLSSAFFALFNYRRNVKLKKAEFLLSIYGKFKDKDIDAIFEKLEGKESIFKDDNKDKEKDTNNLIKLLTLMDEVSYLVDNKLINDNELEYLYYEIAFLQNHPDVIKQINDENNRIGKFFNSDMKEKKIEVIKPNINIKKIENYYPYTGLGCLYDKIDNKLKLK